MPPRDYDDYIAAQTRTERMLRARDEAVDRAWDEEKDRQVQEMVGQKEIRNLRRAECPHCGKQRVRWLGLEQRRYLCVGCGKILRPEDLIESLKRAEATNAQK